MNNIQTKETDFYTATWDVLKPEQGTKIVFMHHPQEYIAQQYDWYMHVALEKAEKVTANRHLLTRDLLIQYRNAIREGFNHQLDKSLKNRWDYPNNRNTIEGIQGYIKRIQEAYDKMMKNICTKI